MEKAFPRPQVNNGSRIITISQEGMDLRDYFAAHPPSYVFKNSLTWGETKELVGLSPSLAIKYWTNEITLKAKVILAYQYADMMLEVRK